MSQPESALNGFGLLCRRHRVKRGMSLLTFADLLKVGLEEITGYEAGQNIPSDIYVDRVCILLGIDEDERDKIRRQSWLKTKTVRCLGYSVKRASFVHRLLAEMNNMRVTQVESVSAAIRRYQE